MHKLTKVDRTEVSRSIYAHARDNPGNLAVVSRRSTLTYEKLANLIDCCAIRLQRMGLSEHTVCALAIQDQLTLLVSWLALNRLGVGIICISQSQQKQDTKSLISECAVHVILSDYGYAWPKTKTVNVNLNALETGERVSLNAVRHNKKLIEHIVMGSGSTGKPKLIAYEFGATLRLMQTYVESAKITSKHRYGPLMDLHYWTPFVSCLIQLHVGATLVLKDINERDAFLFLERFEINTTDATVFHAEQLYQLARKHGRRLQKMKNLSLSASIVTDDLITRLRDAVTTEITVDYGTNECWPVSSIKITQEIRPVGSVGRPVINAAVDIVDDYGNTLPNNQPGHVRIRSAGMFSEYIGQPKETRRRLRGGWFYPGDIGKLNTNGHLILLGRSDQMMVFNGINIYPAVIETVMANHPSVTDVAVMRLKHKIHQDVPVCAVQLHSDSDATEQELLEYGKKRLGVKSAKLMFIIDVIPRNELGKLVRSSMAHILHARIKSRGV
jgi:cyanophycin synthetase